MFIDHLDFPFCEVSVKSLVILLVCIFFSCWLVGILDISLSYFGLSLESRAGRRGLQADNLLGKWSCGTEMEGKRGENRCLLKSVWPLLCETWVQSHWDILESHIKCVSKWSTWSIRVSSSLGPPLTKGFPLWCIKSLTSPDPTCMTDSYKPHIRGS